jgi:hypothetical protein
VGPLFVRLAHEAAAGERPRKDQEEADVRQMLRVYFRAAKSER